MEPQPQPQIIYVVQQKSEKPDLRQTYPTTTATVLGGLHIFCGAIALIADIVGIAHDNIPLSTGIWTSVFFFLSGGLAIGGARSANRCLVVATMVMSIISAISAGLLLILSSILLTASWRIRPVGEAACVLQIVMGVVMLAAAVASSSLTCRPLCCTPRTVSSGTVHYSPGRLAAGGLEDGLERAGLPFLGQERAGLPTDLEKQLEPGQGSAWDGANYQRF